jgi:hypothetical protein
MRNSYFILVSKPEGKRPCGRPGNGFENSIEIDLKEIYKSMNWIHLAEDRDQWWSPTNTVMNFWVQ